MKKAQSTVDYLASSNHQDKQKLAETNWSSKIEHKFLISFLKVAKGIFKKSGPAKKSWV